MSDTDALFEDQLLGYFADDDWAARGAQPVSSIFDQIRKGGRANFRFEQIAAPGTVSELRRVLDEMVSDGLLTCRGHDSDPAYEITDHGIYTASFENPEFASDTKSSRWTDGSDLTTEYLNDRPERDTPTVRAKTIRVEKAVRVDSTSWTGARLVLADEAALERIRGLASDLRNRVHATRFESNSDSQDLKGLCDALVAVCDMAEPELSIIEKILNHPKFKLTAALLAAVATLRGALGI